MLGFVFKLFGGKVVTFGILAVALLAGGLYVALLLEQKNYAELETGFEKQKTMIKEQQNSLVELGTAVETANAGAKAALKQRDDITLAAEQAQAQSQEQMVQLNAAIQSMARDLVQRRQDDLQNYYQAGERRAGYLHRWSLRLGQEGSRTLTPTPGDGGLSTSGEDQDISATDSDPT